MHSWEYHSEWQRRTQNERAESVINRSRKICIIQPVAAHTELLTLEGSEFQIQCAYKISEKSERHRRRQKSLPEHWCMT